MDNKYEIRIQLTKVVRVEATRPDTMVRVLMHTRGGIWTPVGSTEVVKDEVNPEFTQGIVVEYDFSQPQRLRFEVLEFDTAKNRVQCELGHFTVALAEFFRTARLTVSGHVGSRFEYRLTAARLGQDNDAVLLEMEGEGLDRKDLNGKSDPYVKICTFERLPRGNYDNSKPLLLHTTETQFMTLHPRWALQCISKHRFLNNGVEDPDMPVLLVCYDWDEVGEHDLIGEVQTTYRELVQSGGKELQLPLFNAERRRTVKKYTHSGVLKVRATLQPMPRMPLYLAAGTRFKHALVVDFTLFGNKHSFERDSLHYVPPNADVSNTGGLSNPYAMVLRDLLPILSPYVRTDCLAFGVGAKLPPKNKVSEFFPLDFENQVEAFANPLDLEHAYFKAAQKLTFAPENMELEPALRALMERVKQDSSGDYWVISVLLSNTVRDMEKTKKALVEMSHLPVSVLLVSIGTANNRLSVLDGDNRVLRAGNNFAVRDCVQAVDTSTLREESSLARLSHLLLAEIPKQFTDHMLRLRATPQISAEDFKVTTKSGPVDEYASRRKMRSLMGDQWCTETKYSNEDAAIDPALFQVVPKPASMLPGGSAASNAPSSWAAAPKPSTPVREANHVVASPPAAAGNWTAAPKSPSPQPPPSNSYSNLPTSAPYMPPVPNKSPSPRPVPAATPNHLSAQLPSTPIPQATALPVPASIQPTGSMPDPSQGRFLPLQVFAYYPNGSNVPTGFWIPFGNAP